MTYGQAIKYLNSFIPNNEKTKWNKYFGLEKVLFLLNKLGNPHLGQNYVHVGGTAGKGSTTAFLASILKEAGYKTGLHNSPHFLTVRERAKINGKNISKEKFLKILREIKPVLDSMESEFGTKPSYYEILLAMAFIYFKQEKTDINVIEVGLGGKLDATNVINSHYQIITNIGLEHTHILGDTKEKILSDKQEIVKLHSTVVSGIQEEELQEMLRKKAKITGSDVYFLNKDFSTQKQYDNTIINQIQGLVFDFATNERSKLKKVIIPTLGDFQISNASLAIMMALQMKREFPLITNDAIKRGLVKTNLIGRFEIIAKDPLTIIDGAHNPDKIKALMDSIKEYYPEKKFVTIFRYKKRPDIMQSIDMLQEISNKIIVCGSTRKGDMGLDPMYDNEDIEKLKDFDNIEFEKKPKKALLKAQEYIAKNPGLGIIATGSIFMISEFIKVH